MDVHINQVTSHVQAVDGQSSFSPETLRTLVSALLPLLREALHHEERVKNERSLHNGYLDRIERGSS